MGLGMCTGHGLSVPGLISGLLCQQHLCMHLTGWVLGEGLAKSGGRNMPSRGQTRPSLRAHSSSLPPRTDCRQRPS